MFNIFKQKMATLIIICILKDYFFMVISRRNYGDKYKKTIKNIKLCIFEFVVNTGMMFLAVVDNYHKVANIRCYTSLSLVNNDGYSQHN